MRPGTITAKDGSVRLEEAEPVLLEALGACARVFGMYGLPCIVTSLNDGHHREGSYHYVGRAADLRSKHAEQKDREPILRALRNALGPTFDVILEARGSENEHFHVEYDPK